MVIQPITKGCDKFEKVKNSRWQNLSLAGGVGVILLPKLLCTVSLFFLKNKV